MKDVKIEFTQEEADALARMVYLEGIAEAKEEILEQGIEQGSKNKTIEVAKSLLSQKISLDVIKKATGLSMKTIKSLIL